VIYYKNYTASNINGVTILLPQTESHVLPRISTICQGQLRNHYKGILSVRKWQ